MLHHLTKPQLKKSFNQQSRVLTPSGVLLHSFWYGNKTEEFSGLRFVYYTVESLRSVIGTDYEIIETAKYTEMEPDDSLYVVLKKRP